MPLNPFEKAVSTIAATQGWTLSQIQLGEDYIRALYTDGIDAPLPTEKINDDSTIELDPKYAALIRKQFLALG